MLTNVTVCWHMLQYADECYSMLTYVTVCWRMLQYADECYSMLTNVTVFWHMLQYADICYSMLTNVTVRWRMLQYADECYSTLTYVTACWHMLQYAQTCSTLPVHSGNLIYAFFFQEQHKPMFIDMFRYAAVCSSIVRYSKECSSTVRYSKTCSDRSQPKESLSQGTATWEISRRLLEAPMLLIFLTSLTFWLHICYPSLFSKIKKLKLVHRSLYHLRSQGCPHL
jgi:hypothetical protein